MKAVLWVAWSASDATAWAFEHHLCPYEVYRRVTDFALRITPRDQLNFWWGE